MVRQHQGPKLKARPTTANTLQESQRPIPARSLIEKLPVEILQHLATFLTLDAAALLALCSRTLATALGTQYWTQIRPVRLTGADFECRTLTEAWFGVSKEHTEPITVPNHQKAGCRCRVQSCQRARPSGKCAHIHPEYRALVDFFLLLRRDLGPDCYFCPLCTRVHDAGFNPSPMGDTLCHSDLMNPMTPYAIPLYDIVAMTMTSLPRTAARLRFYREHADVHHPKYPKEYLKDKEGLPLPPDRPIEVDVDTQLLPDGHMVVRVQEWLQLDIKTKESRLGEALPTVHDAIAALDQVRKTALCPHMQHGLGGAHWCAPSLSVLHGDDVSVHVLCDFCPMEVRVDFWRFRRLVSAAKEQAQKQEKANAKGQKKGTEAERPSSRNLPTTLTIWKDLGEATSPRDPVWRAHLLETSHPAYPAQEMGFLCWQEDKSLGLADIARRSEAQRSDSAKQVERRKLKELLKTASEQSKQSPRGLRGLRGLLKVKMPLVRKASRSKKKSAVLTEAVKDKIVEERRGKVR